MFSRLLHWLLSPKLESHEVLHLLREIRSLLVEIRDEIRRFPASAVITQGERMLTGQILGLAPGASDTFFVTPVDVNGNADALPAGSPVPTFSVDNPNVTVSPAADGLSAVVTASPSATPGSSFNLNWAATFTKQDGTQASITATANVPILTPPVLEPVGAVISQHTPAS